MAPLGDFVKTELEGCCVRLKGYVQENPSPMPAVSLVMTKAELDNLENGAGRDLDKSKLDSACWGVRVVTIPGVSYEAVGRTAPNGKQSSDINGACGFFIPSSNIICLCYEMHTKNRSGYDTWSESGVDYANANVVRNLMRGTTLHEIAHLLVSFQEGADGVRKSPISDVDALKPRYQKFLVDDMHTMQILSHAQGLPQAVSTPQSMKKEDDMIQEMLLCCGVMLAAADAVEFPQHATSLECYPNGIALGDTLCMAVTVHNPHDKSIFMADEFSASYVNCGSVQVDIVEWGMPLRKERDVDAYLERRMLRFIELKPGESRRILSTGWEIPPLEMLHDPKYEQFIRDLPPEGQELTLRVRVHSAVRGSDRGDYEEFITTLEKKFILKPRTEKEMELIESWYDATPKRHFPQILPNEGPGAYPVKWVRWSEEAKPFLVGYPGSVYADKTWQQWKELEDSLEFSTLRDNVRRMRFLKQYQATQDPQVLEEFRTWLLRLPPMQRRNMIHARYIFEEEFRPAIKTVEDLRK